MPESLGPKEERSTLRELLDELGIEVAPPDSEINSEEDAGVPKLAAQANQLAEWRKQEWQKTSDSDPRFAQLRTKAAEVRENVLVQASNEGYEYRGHALANPNFKGNIVLREGSPVLSEDVLKHVMGSGLRVRHFGSEDYELDILLNILGSGVCDSEWAPLQGALYVPPYTSEPFVLLSNYDEHIDGQKGYSTGDSRLRNLRAVYVNAVYEDLVPDLQKAFPWVTFLTADTINDEVLKKKEPPYRSYLDRMRFETDTN